MLRILRSLGRAPLLSLAAVAMLAFGIAALTATLAVMNAAIVRQPPFADAGRIAMLYTTRSDGSRGERSWRERWSYPRIRLLRENQTSFQQIANYSLAAVTLAGVSDAETVSGEMVSSTYFSLLRVAAARGRVFTADEDDVARPSPVALVSHALWRRRWGGDAALVGRTIRVNGRMLTVVGILPDGFRGLTGRAELWLPATMAPTLTYGEYLRTNQNFISLVGRLRPGSSLDDARGELAVLGASINRVLPNDDLRPGEEVGATAVSINEARVDRAIRRAIVVLLGAVAALYLLACANVVNLLLGRAATRRRESAVRLALGSGTGRLFASVAGEGLLLAVIAGAVGSMLAWWATGVVTPPTNAWAARNFYGSIAPFDTPVFGGTELLSALVLTAMTAAFVAVPPALAAIRLDVPSEIRAGSRGIARGVISLRRPSLRGILVGIEAALAMLLVVAAGLLLDSFHRMRHTPLGVETRNVLTFWVIPGEAQIAPSRAPAFVTRLLDAVTRVPGVLSATVDGGAPLAGTARSVLQIVGRAPAPPGEEPPVLRHYVAPDHFRTLGIPLRRGRTFTDGDVAGAPLVAVISETAARRFWPGRDPIGQRVWFPDGSAFSTPDSSVEIVGIVGDVMYEPLDRRPNRASFYTPYAQFTYAFRAVFLRTAGDPMRVVPEVRKALATVDPDVAMRDVQTLDEIASGSWARHRFDALLFGGFGLAALVLAASGVFAVLAYSIANRTRELGVRIALGATSASVVRLVVREGLAFPLAGLALGTAASVGAARVLRSSLYEVSPLEPRVYLATGAVLLAAAVAACLVPAWRATRVDPMVALRAE